MRGKDHYAETELGAAGITPAYAGKSLLRLRRPQWIWDHPRLCGEKLSLQGGLSQSAGITPAYAGKSPNPSLILVVIGDHPRLCGEKCFTLPIAEFYRGSPPPMRGKV